jgi:hypothetical protein
MNGKCIDIGTIQAFLDGETTQDESLRVGRHVADCDECARLLAVAEDENSLVFSALDREMNALVPTQRLWNRINDTIEIEKSRAPVWKQAFAFISTLVASPSMTAAAGVLVVFSFMAVIWTVGPITTDTEAGLVPSEAGREVADNSKSTGEAESASEIGTEKSGSSSVAPRYVKAGNLSDDNLEKLVRDASKIRPTPAIHYAPLPGEDTYIRTIADLKQTVDGRKDEVFTGSSRIDFERDLAVVNDSIRRMQKVVRKNPRNQAARQVLYSSYQDKIDLLNTVAQKDELMALVQ